MRKVVTILVIVVLIGGGIYYWKKRASSGSGKQMVMHRTSKIMRTTIMQSVSATGTIQPMKQVEVGTQVTGRILKLHADFNSVVKAGDVIAEVDPATYQASYAAAQAQLNSALATLEKTTSSLSLAEKELSRMKQLLEKGVASQSEYDIALAERDRLAAERKMNQASIESAKANANQAKTNLDYCTITSPVTGVVISRKVDEGQTVVSNMSVSTLFVIATDLSHVKVEASVPEADVGQLKVGQTVRFTVDAYRQSFTGKVSQIRLAATTESNVVTYPVIVEAENPAMRLFPGMTATLTLIISNTENCLAVPTAALRFTPQGVEKSKGRARRIWLKTENGALEEREVKLGVTDNINQQLLNADDLEGREVVTGVMSANELKKGGASGNVNNPFQMRPPGAPRK